MRRDSCRECIIQEILILNEYQVLNSLGFFMLAAEGLLPTQIMKRKKPWRRTILIVKNKHHPVLMELNSRDYKAFNPTLGILNMYTHTIISD